MRSPLLSLSRQCFFCILTLRRVMFFFFFFLSIHQVLLSYTLTWFSSSLPLYSILDFLQILLFIPYKVFLLSCASPEHILLCITCLTFFPHTDLVSDTLNSSFPSIVSLVLTSSLPVDLNEFLIFGNAPKFVFLLYQPKHQVLQTDRRSIS